MVTLSSRTVAETVVGMFDHIHIVMIDSIGGIGGEGLCFVERHKTVDTDHQIIASADKSQIM
jgi:hypothetical protein